MKMKLKIPKDRSNRTYFGLKDGEVYEALSVDSNTYTLLGDPAVLDSVLVNKDWCEEVPNFEIELPEDIW